VVIVEGGILDVDDVGEGLAERIAASFAARYNGYRTQGRSFFMLVPRGALAWSRFTADADPAPIRADVDAEDRGAVPRLGQRVAYQAGHADQRITRQGEGGYALLAEGALGHALLPKAQRAGGTTLVVGAKDRRGALQRIEPQVTVGHRVLAPRGAQENLALRGSDRRFHEPFLHLVYLAAYGGSAPSRMCALLTARTPQPVGAP